MQILRGPGPLELVKSGIQRRLIPWGEGHHAKFSESYASNIGVSIICEDLPDEENMVSLDTKLTDSDGIPSPKFPTS